MRQKLPVLLIALSILLSIQSVIAQQDTNGVSVTYSEEPTDSSDFSLKEKYKYWTRANVEEKSMFKIGISEFGWAGGPIVGYRFAYERKIGAPFSLLVQYRHNVFGWEGTNTLGADLALRYYYLLPGAIRRGKSANNLSSIYLSLQNNNSWSSLQYSNIINSSLVFSDRMINNSHSLSLLQGIQLRLGKYGYLDANLGPSFNPAYQNSPHRKAFSIDMNFSIGVAF